MVSTHLVEALTYDRRQIPNINPPHLRADALHGDRPKLLDLCRGVLTESHVVGGQRWCMYSLEMVAFGRGVIALNRARRYSLS